MLMTQLFALEIKFVLKLESNICQGNFTDSFLKQAPSLLPGQFQPCQEVDDRIYTLCNPPLVLTNQLTLFLFGTITLMLVEIA